MSKQTDKVISIRVADDATSPIRNIVRTMRSVATAIRQVQRLMVALEALQIKEIARVLAMASAYRFLAVMKTAASLIGVGAAVLAIAASVGMMTQGTNTMPIGQTSAGTSRHVSASGMAVIHAGETISRPASGQTGGHGGGDINITIHSADMSYRAGIEETARDLGTLIYQAYRRERH